MSDEKKARKKKGQRKDNRIQVTYTDGRRPDGKPNRVTFYGRTRAEACRKRDEYKAHGRESLTGEDVTVEAWIERYKELYRARVNPAYLHIDDVPYNRLSRAIGKMYLSCVREVHLQEALNAVAGMSESTIDTYRQTMKRVFERAKRNRLIKDNPASDLIKPDGKSGTHRAIERWESNCIMEHWHEHRCGIWAMLMMLAGLRRGEMLALRWENIDMEVRQLSVCEVIVFKRNQSTIESRAKSDAGIRILPLCQPLWEALNATPIDQRHGLVCYSAKGKQNTESSYFRGWDGFCTAMTRILNDEPAKQAGRRVDVEKRKETAAADGKEYIVFSVKAHDLRHTFATALFDAGVPAKAAQYYLGHADIRITLELYTHLSQEREKITRSQLVGFLDGWLKASKKPPESLPEGHSDG